MCGITGIFSINKLESSLDVIHKMTNAIAHRGPDASGYYTSDNCLLGHRRLSILDTSSGANQPFYSKCDRFVMVYNGEIYNYKELAKKYNISTNTTSDTEVILELFVLKGVDFVKELNGMFAIAILEIQNNILTIFRDRLGIKPLYFYNIEDTFLFSSEIKSIIASGIVEKKINTSAVSAYFQFGYIPHPLSIYSNINKINAGSVTKISSNGIVENNFWDLKSKINEVTFNQYDEVKKELRSKLQISVSNRLISDVPFGTFLSGGIDSSLVTALAQESSGKPINTFSMGFEEAEFDESQYAKKIAKHIGTNHNELIFPEKDAKQLIHELAETFDEPFGDPSALPTMLLSKMTSKHVKMVLAGDGGDELFQGYGFYTWAQRLQNPINNFFKKPISKVLSLNKSLSFQKASTHYNYNQNDHIPSHIFRNEQFLFNPEEVNKLMKIKSIFSFSNENEFDKINRKLKPAEKQSFFDIENYLKDQLLVKVDRASMKYSLEVRVPFLDHNVVEYAINVDYRLKRKGGDIKWIVKEILGDYVPSKFYDRPKRGFGIPVSKWLKNDFKELVFEYLSSDKIKKQEVLDSVEVSRIVNDFYNGNDFYFKRVWVLLIFSMWFDKLLENE